MSWQPRLWLCLSVAWPGPAPTLQVGIVGSHLNIPLVQHNGQARLPMAPVGRMQVDMGCTRRGERSASTACYTHARLHAAGASAGAQARFHNMPRRHPGRATPCQQGRTSQHDACNTGGGEQLQQLIRTARHACSQQQQGRCAASGATVAWRKRATRERYTCQAGLASGRVQACAAGPPSGRAAPQQTSAQPANPPVGADWYAANSASVLALLFVKPFLHASVTDCIVMYTLPTARARGRGQLSGGAAGDGPSQEGGRAPRRGVRVPRPHQHRQC